MCVNWTVTNSHTTLPMYESSCDYIYEQVDAVAGSTKASGDTRTRGFIQNVSVPYSLLYQECVATELLVYSVGIKVAGKQ